MFDCRSVGFGIAFFIAGTGLAQDKPNASPVEEWTRFRGPNGSGISLATNIPATWSPNDFAWKTALPGRGHSSPVIWGNRIFVTSGDEVTGKRWILCLHASDGTIRWQREYPSRTFPKNRDNSYATSTPAVDRNHVFFYWTTPDEITLLALDHDGKDTWRRNLGPFTSQHGSGTSPIVFGDLVLVNNLQEGKSSLLGLDSTTGITRWQIERRTAKVAYSTPCVYQPENGPPQIIFTSTSHGLSSINPQDGRVNWEITNAFPMRAVGSPIIASGKIIATCGEGGVGLRLVAVRPGAMREVPPLVYELSRSIPYVPTPLYKDDVLFLWADNGLVAGHRADTGERMWQIRIQDSFYGSPIWMNRHLYCLSKNGTLYVVALLEKPEVSAAIPLGEAAFSTPAVAGGRMFFRTESHLFAIGGEKPMLQKAR
ncbi:MAG TPA: PQQ-binding-like beta-propeller repeat protein [Candidatus Paceibacterota bacterium]|nr:PQQ-binding-like beta-propeller repeat protein [Verrucomicrobiota bacterium]HRY48555.1 PQQ-binding-like beta-propeller repeat protein [Candidatus Paceibacterota bacterium]HRZ99893.1 PQQ-binding-like beta-propeller repeat protein [Candidatus Paceibacterota bacterium]